jgi:predicted TIM-barrel fold metal-dependent hydrolase
MIIDGNVLIGNWPFRKLPCIKAGQVQKILLASGINRALAASLDAILFRNVQDGNEILYSDLARHRDFFTPVATINPSYARWEKDYEQALQEKCAAIRIYPEYQGWRLLDFCARELYRACQEDNLPLILTAEIEDARQRHPLDKPADWTSAEAKQLIEEFEDLKLLVVNARAEKLKEIALSLSEENRKRIFFDISAVWGAFVDDLDLCLKQVGVSQFVFGSHAALKTPETAVTKLGLSKIKEQEKRQIIELNIRQLMPRLKI